VTTPVPRRGTAGAILSLLVSVVYVLFAMVGLGVRATSGYVLGSLAIAGLVAATLALMKKRAGLWACALVHAGVILYFVVRIFIGEGSILSAFPIALSMPPAGLCLWSLLKPQL
jgi:hypothetical protein